MRISIPKFNPVKPSPEHVAFGRRLQSARDAAGIVQADLHALLGLHPSIVSQLENARRRCEVFELYALSKVYQEPMEYLVGGDTVIPRHGTIELDANVQPVVAALMRLPEDARARLGRQFLALIDSERRIAASA